MEYDDSVSEDYWDYPYDRDITQTIIDGVRRFDAASKEWSIRMETERDEEGEPHPSTSEEDDLEMMETLGDLMHSADTSVYLAEIRMMYELSYLRELVVRMVGICTVLKEVGQDVEDGIGMSRAVRGRLKRFMDSLHP